MSDFYFFHLLLCISLPPSLLCKHCINSVGRKRVALCWFRLVCLSLHPSWLVRQCGIQEQLVHTTKVTLKMPFSWDPEASLKDVWTHDGECKHRDRHSDIIHSAAQLHVTECHQLQKDMDGVP